MNFERKIQARIMLGYIAMLIVGIGIVFILLHERKRASEIEAETKEIHALREGIQAAHRHVARLAALGEGVIGWEAADSARYHALRLRTDSLLQTLKPHCTGYVRPGQIDTLCSLLADKEVHLLHIMEAMQRQEAADSLLVNHLPEVARGPHASAPSGGRKTDLPAHWAASGRYRYCPWPANCTPSATAWWPCSGSVRRKWTPMPTACARATGR